MVKRYIIILIFTFIICTNLSSEIIDNFDFILRSSGNKKIKIEKKQFKISDVSEIKMFALGLIKLYQKFISSQDTDTCMFTFSCSHFGIHAIKQYGIFWGSIITLDRLQRCTGIGHIYYPADPEKRKAVDYPIQLYYLPRSNNAKD